MLVKLNDSCLLILFELMKMMRAEVRILKHSQDK